MQVQRIVFVLLCLACAGNGRRANKVARQSADRAHSLRAMAALLRTHDQAAAFQITGMQPGRGLSVKNRMVRLAGYPSCRVARTASMMADTVTDKETPEETVADKGTPEDCGCSIDNLGACSFEELEILYIDALWSYYTEKKPLITDDQYYKLVLELEWQGSGFPSLRRNEIAFVKAALAFAKGKPSVSDKKWEEMKAEIKASTGKRQEVTEFLLYTRSLKETAETRQRLMEEMAKSGMSISVTPSGVSCTLSDVPTTLTPNVPEVLTMYLALSAIPTTLALLGWVLVALILGGPEGSEWYQGIVDTAIPGIPIAGAISALLTTTLIKYVELAQPELLEGLCPCCEVKMNYMSTSFNEREPTLTCQECKTDVVFNCDKREIGKAGGLNVISAEDGEASKGRWIDDVLSRSLLKGISDITLGQPNKETRLGGPGKSEKTVVPKDMTKFRYFLENFNEGLYAPAVLVGYAVFGEQFVIRARGKLIQLHSAAINSFCTRFGIPAKMKKTYVETAKRNGEDLGMLVFPPKLYGDGLFGKQALAFWKAQGW